MVGGVSFSYGNGARSAESREEASRGTHDAAGETPALPISEDKDEDEEESVRASLPRLLQEKNEDEDDGEEASRGTHDAAGETPALPISKDEDEEESVRASLPRLLQDGEEDFFLALRAAASSMA